MKKSHKKLLIFQGVIFLIFILNSFVSNILKEYNFVILLAVSLLGFKVFFGFERDRHRYTKDVIFDVIIFLLIFFSLFYLFGLVIGFAKTANYYNWYGVKEFILPLILSVVLKEILRYMMLRKSEGCSLLYITTYILFVFLDVTDALYYNNFESGYKTFIFIALTLLPALSSNLVCNYISIKSGYKPLLVYLLATRLYVYLIPIIPNPNEYITSIIHFLLPIFLGYRIYSFYQNEKDDYTDRDYNKKNIGALVLPTLLTVIMVYFTSGYFSYYAVAIASGSMEPKISKGDVVIIKKIESDYDSLENGQIIAYRYNGVIVVHRIINIVNEEGKYYFYTQGDANANPDNYAITEDMVLGTINFWIPFVGLPTVWLNEM